MTPNLSMTARASIPVDDLTAGMVLGESVHDGQGRLLMPAGTELTERHLRAFQLWGIMAVKIRGAAGAEDTVAEVSPEELAAAVERVMPRFVHNDVQHPLIAILLHECAVREAGRLARGGHA